MRRPIYKLNSYATFAIVHQAAKDVLRHTRGVVTLSCYVNTNQRFEMYFTLNEDLEYADSLYQMFTSALNAILSRTRRTLIYNTELQTESMESRGGIEVDGKTFERIAIITVINGNTDMFLC